MKRRDFILGAVAAVVTPAHAGEPLPSAAERLMPVSPPRRITGLEMLDSKGTSVSLTSFRGQVVILNLWAPWCLPCRAEMPALSRLQHKISPQGGSVLPLSFDWQGASGVKQFFEEQGITNLPVLVGEGKNLQAATGIVGLPSTLILAPEGEHVATVIGAADWDDAATVDYLLGLRD